jgi:hypothetical protein
LGLKEFNRKKKLVKDSINDNAKRMKGNLEPLPDSPRKRKWMKDIENARKRTLTRLKDLTTSGSTKKKAKSSRKAI